mmetsp:Transcript_7498/g.14243  ORF Transcript_7498/g.14243 Transcript_7498/m.14243 type:complete len:254 (-) Transcript_7498:1086-1847(-)
MGRGGRVRGQPNLHARKLLHILFGRRRRRRRRRRRERTAQTAKGQSIPVRGRGRRHRSFSIRGTILQTLPPRNHSHIRRPRRCPPTPPLPGVRQRHRLHAPPRRDALFLRRKTPSLLGGQIVETRRGNAQGGHARCRGSRPHPRPPEDGHRGRLRRAVRTVAAVGVREHTTTARTGEEGGDRGGQVGEAAGGGEDGHGRGGGAEEGVRGRLRRVREGVAGVVGERGCRCRGFGRRGWVGRNGGGSGCGSRHSH